MNDFIAHNPALVAWFFGGLFTLISILGTLLVWFVKRAFDNLCAAIGELRESIANENTEIGILKDRMQKQETTCNMQRTLCPNQRCPQIHPSMIQVKKDRQS